MTYVPALVIVDVQEDFCPPNGTLAVTDGRTIVPLLNELLDLPFVIKIATKDFHPQDHVSFASNHPPPNNKPFVSMATIMNPQNPKESIESRLWPDHCVQGTPGAELLPELHVNKVHEVVEKGKDKRVEMYSAFADPFLNPCVVKSGLAKLLHDKGVTDVFVAGLAADYCVRYTALDSAKEGFKTRVVGEATKPVSPESMEEVLQEYTAAGVDVIEMSNDSIEKVKQLR
ncbi:unnamed protein product [Periconia digitata]|uniref:nicotinamidase n=1 Tax=Periconia digitata TaxID=1303443 RepID=A0A9W4UEH7_9PLEO|nr:unnamed protein product [Periconia digitata]